MDRQTTAQTLKRNTDEPPSQNGYGSFFLMMTVVSLICGTCVMAASASRFDIAASLVNVNQLDDERQRV